MYYEDGNPIEDGGWVVYTRGPREDWDYGRVDVEDSEPGEPYVTVHWLVAETVAPLRDARGLVAYRTLDAARVAYDAAFSRGA